MTEDQIRSLAVRLTSVEEQVRICLSALRIYADENMWGSIPWAEDGEADKREFIAPPKCKQGFDWAREVIAKIGHLETTEIESDYRLFNQVLASTETLEDDLRAGRLCSAEEAFGMS